MPSNSSDYSKKYYLKKSKKLFTQLGGRCYMCRTKKNLMVHRVYKASHYFSKDGSLPKIFDTDIKDNITLKTLTKEEIESRAKALFNNPDNMILLCTGCFKSAVRYYGRKTVIGKRKLHYLLGE